MENSQNCTDALKLIPLQSLSVFSSMRAACLSLYTLFIIIGVDALVVPRQNPNRNDGIHLAVGPNCGPLFGPAMDVNAGLDLTKYRTIVSFGVG